MLLSHWRRSRIALSTPVAEMDCAAFLGESRPFPPYQLLREGWSLLPIKSSASVRSRDRKRNAARTSRQTHSVDGFLLYPRDLADFMPRKSSGIFARILFSSDLLGCEGVAPQAIAAPQSRCSPSSQTLYNGFPKAPLTRHYSRLAAMDRGFSSGSSWVSSRSSMTGHHDSLTQAPDPIVPRSVT
jgi:hypothetical protein